ncbi:hypothetical protein BKA56DRAFT_487267, partial [Ilyonectria sp. MPI-CAGE-AT-0026]
ENALDILLRNVCQSQIRVHKPPPSSMRVLATSGSLSVVLNSGGASVAGDGTQLSAYAKTEVVLYGATVVNISYPLACVVKFPTEPNDVWHSLFSILHNADSMDADITAEFILGGVSATANLAAVIAQGTIEEKFCLPLTGGWLSTPLVLD